MARVIVLLKNSYSIQTTFGMVKKSIVATLVATKVCWLKLKFQHPKCFFLLGIALFYSQ